MKIPKLYVLKDPTTNEIRYVGITIRSLKERLSGHISDAKCRPELNYHKINWINSLLDKKLLPVIELVKEFETINEAKQAEIDYIKEYKIKYNLTNCTIGGDRLGERSHSRESILKRKTTRAITQYNIFGEKLRDFEITEDATRFLNLTSASKITSCCKRERDHACGYIWRYKDEPLGDISHIDSYSLSFNSLIQSDLNGNFIEIYDSYLKASNAVNDLSKGGNIAMAAKGKQQTCKGFIWHLEPKFEYVNEEFVIIMKQFSKPKPTKKVGIKIIQLSLDGEELKIFPSVSEASREVLGTINGRYKIIECCENKRSEYKNFKWKYCPA